MASRKTLLIMLFGLLSGMSSQALEEATIEGIYVNRSYHSAAQNAYLAVHHVFGDDFFVLFTDPFASHQYDFATIGRRVASATIEVVTPSSTWYLECRDDGVIWLNWQSMTDPEAREFQPVTGKVDASIVYSGNSEISVPRFQEHIREELRHGDK